MPVVRSIARINGSARSANSGTQLVSQLFDQGEVFFGANATAAGNNHASRCQLGAIAFCNVVFNPGRQAGIGRSGYRLYRGGATVARGVKRRGAEGDNLFRIRGFDRLDRVARIDGTLERVGVDNTGHIGQQHDVKQRSNTWHHVFSVCGRWRGDVIVITGERYDQRRRGFREAVAKGLILGDQNFGNTVDFRRRFARRSGGTTSAENSNIAEHLGRSNGFGCRVKRQFAISYFCKE